MPNLPCPDMNRALLLLLLSCLLLLTGCKSKPKPVAQPTGQATLIGIIEMVNPEQNYVLIRCEPMPNLAPGTELIALSANGTKSKLVLTPEKKGHYVTADIKEGSPQVHHLVLVQRGEATATSPAAAPATPAAPTMPLTPSGYQPMPFLPGITPTTGGTSAPAPLTPLTIPEPQQPAPAKPQTPAAPPESGLGGLEPPVGNP